MNLKEALRGKCRQILVFTLAACLVGGVSGAPAAANTRSDTTVSAQASAVGASSIQPIAGVWREAGDPEPRVLTIYADGAYELVYPEGKAFGTVRLTDEEHPDGSKSFWYSFYEEGGLTLEDAGSEDPWYSAYASDNEFWTAFAKVDGVSTQTDLYSGQDGAMHFVRGWEEDYHATSIGVKAADYVGVWGNGRCSIVISQEGAGYLVEIQWASSAAEGSRWTYHCTYDNDAAILFSNSRSNGTRIDYVFTEDGKGTDKEIYNDGSAVFVMRNGTLTWQDKKENFSEGMGFLK